MSEQYEEKQDRHFPATRQKVVICAVRALRLRKCRVNPSDLISHIWRAREFKRLDHTPSRIANGDHAMGWTRRTADAWWDFLTEREAARHNPAPV